MNALVITVILLGCITLGVWALESCKPLNRWLEKQSWWKEIVGDER